MQQCCLALLATQQVAAVGSMLDPALCFIRNQLHFPLCLVLLPWKKSHWAKLSFTTSQSLQRLFPFLVSTQETLSMLQANIQKYIFF